MTTTASDFNVCRLCLGDRPMVDIFQSDLIYKIEMFCGLQLNENDGLPKFVCHHCVQMLDVSLNFKAKCKESDRTLREKLNLDFVDDSKSDMLPMDMLEGPVLSIIKEELYDDVFDCGAIKQESNASIIFKQEDEGFSRSLPGVFVACTNYSKKSVKKEKKKFRRKLRNNNVLKDKSQSLCSICGMVLSFSSYAKHMRRQHNILKFVCDVCKKECKDRARLIAHLQTHNEKKYPCEVCGRLFKTSHDVHRHNRIVHKKIGAVECNVCNKIIATAVGLRRHMISHTGEKNYECDICKQRFSCKYSITSHMRIHLNLKPYVCGYCQTSFRTLKTMKAHEMLHTGERPYQCPECIQRFTQLSNMKSHFRNNHRGLPFNYEHKKKGIKW